MSDVTFSIEAIVDDAVANVKNFGASMNQTANNGVNNFRQLNRAFGLLNKGVQEVEAAFKFARDEAEKLGRVDVATNIDAAKDSFAGLADILVQVPIGGRDFLQWMGDAAAGAENLAHLVGALAIQFQLNTGAIDQATAKLQLDAMLTDEVAAKKNALAAATKSVSDKLVESDAAYNNSTAAAGAMQGALDRVKASQDKVKDGADAQAKAENDAATAQANLKSNQDGWLGSTADQAEAALKKAGASAGEYAAGLQAIDNALGTHKAVDAQQQQDIDNLTQRYVDGKISVEAYNSGLQDIEAVYMPKASSAMDLGKEHLIEFGTKGIDPITGKLLNNLQPAFLTGSGAASDFGKELKKQSDPGGNMYVYAVGMDILIAKAKDLKNALGAIPELPGGGGSGSGNGSVAGVRDSGGPGVAGSTYLIGTGAQPELFTPSTNGTFTPNGGGSESGGGGNLNIYIGGELIYTINQREARARGDNTVQVN